MAKHPKRPRDPNQLAHMVVGIVTGAVEKASPDGDKNPAAVALGRRGGLKGGKARAASMTPERRKEIARAAATKRWMKD